MRRLSFFVLLLVLVLVPASPVGARECRDDLDEAAGYTIRSVTVEGRWVPSLTLPIKAGDRFSNAGVQAAMRAVRHALHGEDRFAFELQSLGAVGVLYLSPCLLVEDHLVDVVIRARSVRVDLFEVGGNVLPIPRSLLATFYKVVPAPLLALKPTFGAYQDEEYGFAPIGSLSGKLSPRLELAASGRKSIERSFYDANVNLAFNQLRPGERWERLSLDLTYHGSREPQSDTTFAEQAGAFGGSLRLRPRLGFIQTLSMGAHYRFSDNQLTNEHAAQVRALIDGRTGGAFLRAGLWADAAWPDRGSSYGRIAALAAVQKEFLLGKNQTIGVEAVLGGGRAWSAPAYARFYGGNTNRNFLYESLDSPLLSDFPEGPVVRSFGEGQSLRRSSNGDRGANSYWHLNFNISFPLPALSRPLIPDEEVLPGVSLKQILKNKAGDSVSHYAVQLEEEGFSEDEAMARAKAMYGEVRPAIQFIADRANVFALKPLLLCDLAGQDGPWRGHQFQSALGGGLQLTIVTARMEAGYMHTLTGGNGGDSGNFFARIVFENIF